jgi:hypothetical protein
MKLALRRNAATDATFVQKMAVKVIEARLVTEFPHAGLVIGDYLYHASAAKGLHKTEFTPSRWELVDIGTEKDLQALNFFTRLEGTPYDWIELLDYTPMTWGVDLVKLHPDWRASLEARLYCYQWCYLGMTGEYPGKRVTAETLLFTAAAINARRLTTLQETLRQNSLQIALV